MRFHNDNFTLVMAPEQRYFQIKWSIERAEYAHESLKQVERLLSKYARVDIISTQTRRIANSPYMQLVIIADVFDA